MNGLVEVVYKQGYICPLSIYFAVSTVDSSVKGQYVCFQCCDFLSIWIVLHMYFTFDPKTKKQLDCIFNLLNKFESDVTF